MSLDQFSSRCLLSCGNERKAVFTYKEEKIMPKEKVRQQMERMQALPQRRFIRHQTGGDEYYLYADVAGCKCVWRGDKAAYSRYKELARERKVDYKDALYESQDEELLPDIGWE